MRFEKTVTIPEETRQALDHIRCDLCAEETHEPNNWFHKHNFGRNKVTVKLEQGYKWPDSIDITKTIFDICPKCFRDKLVPWFKSQGAEPREEVRD